jgi:phytoene dehydrogenase-like protein
MHGEALAKQGFALVPAQHCFATAFPDGRWIGVSSDLETTAARIAGFSEKDAETWRQMVRNSPRTRRTSFRCSARR